MLRRLAIRDLRVIAAADLPLAPGLNLIQGPNASGKTTVLEAIHLAATGKPLRGTTAADAIRRGANGAGIQATTQTATLSLTLTATSRRVAIDDQPATRAEAARACPFLLIMPGAQRDFFSEAEARRRALRWAVFHVEPSYAPAWMRYARALAQRNAALRAGDMATAWALDPILVRDGEVLTAQEAAFCDEWAGALRAVGVRWGLRYVPGAEGPLQTALLAARPADSRRGVTSVGPHRSDVALEDAGERPGHFASHGQLKMLYLTLRFCQLDVISACARTAPLVLIDDLRAELDSEHCHALVRALNQRALQVIATTVDYPPGEFDATFHVEQGRVDKVV